MTVSPPHFLRWAASDIPGLDRGGYLIGIFAESLSAPKAKSVG
jgi:hypothetical protein